MKIGIPKETKIHETRVALTPSAVAELIRTKHTVNIETKAGLASGFSDDSYQNIGAIIQPDAAAVYAASELIVKVKEPQPNEWQLLQAKHTLFCYLHLAALPELTHELTRIGLTAIGFETLEVNEKLPLLAPMSDIAGKIAVQLGSHFLYSTHKGGKGLLLGGISGTHRGHVVIVGAGIAGSSSAKLAARMGAQVTVFDRKSEALERLTETYSNITGLHANQFDMAKAISIADLVIGAVLIPGATAPKIITKSMVEAMQPGSVIVDISIDQGGCIETIHPTDYQNPSYQYAEITHIAVTNLPAAVPQTATQALSSAILPYIFHLIQEPNHPIVAKAINVRSGEIIHPAVKASIGH